jgi:hypothetical protein
MNVRMRFGESKMALVPTMLAQKSRDSHQGEIADRDLVAVVVAGVAGIVHAVIFAPQTHMISLGGLS